MPISCHFRDCKALLVTYSCKKRSNKYRDFYLRSCVLLKNCTLHCNVVSFDTVTFCPAISCLSFLEPTPLVLAFFVLQDRVWVQHGKGRFRYMYGQALQSKNLYSSPTDKWLYLVVVVVDIVDMMIVEKVQVQKCLWSTDWMAECPLEIKT